MISKLKLHIKNEDGTFTEFTEILPSEIAEEILIHAIDWKNRYSSKVKTVYNFIEDCKNPEKLKNLE
jgi:hypothetical protein